MSTGQEQRQRQLWLLRQGEEEARALAPILTRQSFAAVFSSPLQRARRTCDLGGLGGQMQIMEDLLEWNYGENADQVQARCEKAIARWNAPTEPGV
ncbi:putative phosphoglycerate mutase [Synechococcus sp. A15-127]|uniref:histidine phosphatase family protein n=1 Tax=Synechococcus sp. A15-127 TaxID=1050624 RepID=UPI001647D9C5|nr:histidine phosphatase family protein [Synechococcus sp. A15-127]QNI95055.1 putative phosphoglycerate mutase [Synechococcus sp. A15-127]